MIRKIEELIMEHENRIAQQDDIIARSQFEPDERIFTERKRAIARLLYLMDLKEQGQEYSNVEVFNELNM